jgi:DNA polymerase-1
LKLAIDTDILLFQACFGAQNVLDWGDGNKSVDADINKAKNTFRATIREYQNYTGVKEFVLCLSSITNFRKSHWSGYKANRKDGERPVLLPELREWVEASYPTMMIEHLEADDVLGILATRHPGEIIHCSMDKDLQTIPGRMLHVKKNRKHLLLDITPEMAKEFHYIQTMTGDGCDGVPGVYGVGPAKAKKYLAKYGITWNAVIQCYRDNGVPEDEALRNAIMVKILDNDHYIDGVVKIWEPPHDEKVEP